jgi:anti-anti-sigma factor
MDELTRNTTPLITITVAPEGDDGLRVAITGELDMSNIDQLEAAVSPELVREPARLVVDVAGLTFADSSAIALWVRWAGLVDDFELRSPPGLLRHVIRTMGLADKLRLTP